MASHKARTLLTPYLFYSLLALIYLLICCVVGGDGYRPLVGGIVHTVTLRGISTLWFLPTLFWAYVLHELFSIATSRLGRRTGIVVDVVLFVAVPALCITVSLSSLVGADTGGYALLLLHEVVLVAVKSVAAWWFLEIGAFWERLAQHVAGPVHLAVFGGSLLVAVVLGPASIDFNNLDFGNWPVLFFVLGVTMSCGLLGLLRWANLRMGWLQSVGRASLFVMCTHLPLPVLTVCEHVVLPFLPRQEVLDASYLLYCAVTLCLVMVVEMLLWKTWGKVKQAVVGRSWLAFVRYC